ncbi:MAG: hypothetical protein AB3N18_00685 [Allomuricauda sp.]
MAFFKLQIILAFVLCSFSAKGQEITNADVRKQKIDSLLKFLGGEDIWAKAKGFRMLEIATYSGLEHPMVREFWVDFEQPRIKMITKSIERRETVALNNKNGWTKDQEGKVTPWNQNRVNGWQSFWPGIPTRIFSRLAKKDASVSFKVYEDRIDFYVNDKFAVWIATSQNGSPVAYGRSKEHTETHFLGEIVPYGQVNLWKDAYEPGGHWRFTMVDYELLSDMDQISFEE